jgi:prefoldin subunit 5
MDEVERQVCLAESFFTEAKAKAKEARKIANLPLYLDQRLSRLLSQIERIDSVKGSIQSVRDTIPKGTIEAEQERLKYGSQQSII